MIGRWLMRAMASITSVEQLRHGADADDAGRPQRLDRLDERCTGARSWANGF